MILANSKGKNKGKKYLKKDKVDVVYADSAELFNTWFSENYNSLISFIKDKYIYDEDVFHETYKNIYDAILFSNVNIPDHKPYILRSYYTNLILNKSKNSRYCELLPNTDRDDIDDEYFTEIEEKQMKLEADIMKYIYDNYSLRDFELFKMYMSLKPAVNYSVLSKITGVRTHTIQRTVSKIKKDVQTNEEFIKRRDEIL